MLWFLLCRLDSTSLPGRTVVVELGSHGESNLVGVKFVRGPTLTQHSCLDLQYTCTFMKAIMLLGRLARDVPKALRHSVPSFARPRHMLFENFPSYPFREKNSGLERCFSAPRGQ